ncbi:MAG: hypothetical protein ABI594_08020 [Ginsengibacter sp.]
MKRKLGIIIQARTNSRRLPNKTLAQIDEKPLIIYLYERVKNHFDLPIIIATTTNSKDDEMVSLLKSYNINLFRGSEENVIDRFIETCYRFEITDIVRVCCDNPFLDLAYLEQLVNIWHCNGYSDYISFEFKNKPVILSHFGVFTEIVKLSALENVVRIYPQNKKYFEHVTNGVYMNPQIFKIHLVNLDDELSRYEGVRLTIDTKEDLFRISNLTPLSKNKNFKEIAEYVLSQPHLFEGMKNTIKDQQK